MLAGERVRLKADSTLRTKHVELADAVGIVSSTLHTNGNALLHVRFKDINLVVLNVLAREFEPADAIEPRLRLI